VGPTQKKVLEKISPQISPRIILRSKCTPNLNFYLKWCKCVYCCGIFEPTTRKNTIFSHIYFPKRVQSWFTFWSQYNFGDNLEIFFSKIFLCWGLYLCFCNKQFVHWNLYDITLVWRKLFTKRSKPFSFLFVTNFQSIWIWFVIKSIMAHYNLYWL